MNKNKDTKWLKGLDVELIVEAGSTVKSVEEIMLWRIGTSIKLEDSTKNVLKLLANNIHFANGSVLRNRDGEMSLKIDKVLRDERINVNELSKNNDL